MPNYCENKLVVVNPTDSFTDYLKENGFSFNKIAPPIYPEGEDETGWNTIAAQTAAWGTKWDLDDETQERVLEHLLEYDSASFDTAWSPPIEAIRALSEKFPHIDFELHYSEQGMGFYGSAYISDGCVDDQNSDTSDKEEYVKFLVDTMEYDEDFAKEAVFFDDEEENEEEE